MFFVEFRDENHRHAVPGHRCDHRHLFGKILADILPGPVAAGTQEGTMQFIALIGAVVVSLMAALGTAEAILRVLFVVMSKLR